MLSPIYSLWNIGHPLYAYSSIFIIILIIWQVKRRYHRLRLEPKKSCCRRHQKVRQRARDAASRARRLSQEEADKPWELLSIMKSQSWLPKDRHVRQLLCADPCCRTCNTALLEIQQLLEGESKQISPTSPELPQDSSCLEMSISSLSFEQHVEHCPRYSTDISWAPVAPTLTQLSEYITQSTSAVSIQEYWADHLQVGQEFQLAAMPTVPETVASSRPEEPMVPQDKQEKTQSKPKLVQENQDSCHLKSSISILSLNSEITNLSRTAASQMDSVLPAYLSFLSPKVRRLLEAHVKKWIHFQKWGLPRRVEDSLRQFMPDPMLFGQFRNKQLSSTLNNLSDVTTDKIGTISHQTRSSCLAGQPTKTRWVYEWSVIDIDQRNHYHQKQNLKALTLTSQEVEHLSGIYSLPGGQINDSEINMQEKYSQLFCGLPSLHSESLVATFLGSEGLSNNKYMSKLSLKDPDLLQELSHIPLMPKTPPKSVSSSSLASPNGKTPHEHEEPQTGVPFLTLAEREALESHLLHRQLQLQWGLPAIFLRAQRIQSHTQYEACDKVQLPDSTKIFWPGKPFSDLNRKLFFPEPARRQLEFHLQRQLIHLRWGLPQRIQQSIQLFLSSTDQQPLWSCTALPSAGTPQPEERQANGTGDLYSAIVDKGPIPVPHLFAQVKEILRSHINSKCGQIHQNKLPTYVQSSGECKIPGDLEGTPYIPQNQSLELQAANDHDLHHELVPWTPTAPGREQEASPGAVAEHCKRPQALPEETVEKLETALRHKYLTFLSGLPALYGAALSGASSPEAAAGQPEMADAAPGPARVPAAPLTRPSSPEDPREPPDPEEEPQPGAQAGESGQAPAESRTRPACAPALTTPVLTTLNFHVKRKVPAIQPGASEREREVEDPTTAEATSASPGSPNDQGEMVLQKPPVPPDFLPALDAKWVHFKEQLNNELKAVYSNQKQLTAETMPDGSARWASKQLSRDMAEAQVLCVQVEAGRNSPNLQEPWAAEPQGPGKHKDSAHGPRLAERSRAPEKPKGAGDLGEGDAGLRLLPTTGERPRAGAQMSDKTLLSRTPHSSWQQKHGFYFVDPCPDGPQQTPQLQLPQPPPGGPGGQGSAHDMNDSQTELNVILEPARIPENALPAVPQASKGHPFFGHPTQGKLLQSQTGQGRVLQRSVMPAIPPKRPSLPESAWRERMKSFLHSINLRTKGKGPVESTTSTAAKVARTRKENVDKSPAPTRKENVDKSPAPAKSLAENTKPEKPRGPKGQTAPTEKPVGPAFLTGTQSSNNEIRLRSRQGGLASVPGYPRHCPRHCPRMACGTRLGSPP
uniref:protein FAM205A-like n=1 Tax=Jaculus jaculus TaxID=51337 RepID=UPI001E1B1D2C|nr:protein FAM205A-like [Jaculus jaculus]